jgi:hypothetical protein
MYSDMKMDVLWVVASCSLVEIDRRFRGASITRVITTWRNTPEDSHLQTHRRENLKSHRILASQERLCFMESANN